MEVFLGEVGAWVASSKSGTMLMTLPRSAVVNLGLKSGDRLLVYYDTDRRALIVRKKEGERGRG